MVVIIPSYKRTFLLKYVIQSVLDCQVSRIDERILILVVNNFIPNKDVVNEIVENVEVFGKFYCKAIHREFKMSPIESWYTALFTNAKYNEVVVLLGDDDVLLPWGLENRFCEVTKTNSDMLLSDFYDQIYFFNNGTDYWMDCPTPELPPIRATAVEWEGLSGTRPLASFLSNHCYRNTDSFMRGFKTAMYWCRSQNWVPMEIATANFPLYIAHAIKAANGKVVALSEKSVLRGSISEEIRVQDYADGGNSAFYHLLIYNTFSNAELHQNLHYYDGLCAHYKRGFIGGVLSIFQNKTIEWKLVTKTLKKSKFGFNEFFAFALLSNIRSLVRLFPWFRGYRIRKIERSEKLLPMMDFGHYIKGAAFKND
jgi:hypothetical protein